MTSTTHAGRRVIAAAVIAVTAALATTSAAFAASAARPAAASAAAATPACKTSGLEVWLGLGPGGGTAGSTYHPIEFTNVTGHTCHLFGFPGVSAIYNGHQAGSPAGWGTSPFFPKRTVTLAPNGVALSTHTRFRCDIGHYARRVAPGHHVVGRSSMPKSKAIGRRGYRHASSAIVKL